MKPEKWSERLLGFALSAVVGVLMLRFAWGELQPLLPVLAAGLVLWGFFRWQYRR